MTDCFSDILRMRWISIQGSPLARTLAMAVPGAFRPAAQSAPVPASSAMQSGASSQSAVDVPALVREVRQAEMWIHDVKSFYVRFEGEWTRTEYGIAKRRAELKAQFPDWNPDPQRDTGLRSKLSEWLVIGFDDRRIASINHNDGQHDHRVWDGQRAIDHDTYFTHQQEHYAFHNKPEEFLADTSPGLSWLRAQPHSFWWRPAQEPQGPDEACAKPQDWRLVGQESFNGVDCYVLALPHEAIRWWVGVKDHRQYAFAHYAWKDDALVPWIIHYLTDWKEIAPGRWMPMIQGYCFVDLVDGQLQEVSHRRDHVTEVRIDQPLPEEIFQIQFKEGVQVHDWGNKPPLHYTYKKDRSSQEWAEIVAKATASEGEFEAATAALDRLVGQEPPAFPPECRWLNSQPLTWDALKGEVVVIDFFSEGCGPCRNDLPHMNDLFGRRQEHGLVVLGIHGAGSQRKAIDELVDLFKLRYPICIDVPVRGNPAGWGHLFTQWAIYGIPHAFVVGPDGRIAGHGELGRMVQLAMNLKTSPAATPPAASQPAPRAPTGQGT